MNRGKACPKRKGLLMKKLVGLASAAALGLGLAACDSAAENAVEEEAEAVEDAAEAQADVIEETAEGTAMEEAAEEEAEAVEEAGEETADAMQEQADNMDAAPQ
jgi:hypothetical protein